MKFFSLPLLTLLVFFALNNNEVHSRTMRDLMLEVMTETMPCSVPCNLENFDSIADEYAWGECFNNTLKDVIGLTQYYEKLFGDNSDNPFIIVEKLDPICDAVRKSLKGKKDCPHEIISKYCGNNLANKMVEHVNEVLTYIGCDNHPKGNMLKCMANPKLIQSLILTCAAKFKKHEEDFKEIGNLVENNYAGFYTKYLKGREMCKIASTAHECFFDVVKASTDAPCVSAMADFTAEVNALFEFLDCGATPSNYYDVMRCAPDPSLIAEVMKEYQQFDTTNIQNSVTFINNMPVIKVEKLCDVNDFMEKIISKPMASTANCAKDGWTRETYVKVWTPTHDYLEEKACGKKVNGDGFCTTKFPDLKVFNSSSTISVQYLSVWLSLMAMWIFKK